MLFRCCFHHIVENLILYKKDIQPFYIGPILFSEIKSYGRWSAEKLTVTFYLAPGVRNRKFYLAPGMRNGKIYLAPNDSYENFYLAVKGLTYTANVGRSTTAARFRMVAKCVYVGVSFISRVHLCRNRY